MLIVLVLIASQLWTEVLWYQQVGYLQVYRTELITRVLLFVVGGALMAVAVASSLLIGYRSRPIYAPVSAEQVGLDRYRESIEPLRRLVGIASRSAWPCSPDRPPASSGRRCSCG